MSEQKETFREVIIRTVNKNGEDRTTVEFMTDNEEILEFIDSKDKGHAAAIAEIGAGVAVLAKLMDKSPVDVIGAMYISMMAKYNNMTYVWQPSELRIKKID